MNPSNESELLKKPHAYVKRPDGSSGYEPVVEINLVPEPVIPEVVVEETKPEAAKEKSWGKNTTSTAAAKNAAK